MRICPSVVQICMIGLIEVQLFFLFFFFLDKWMKRLLVNSDCLDVLKALPLIGKDKRSIFLDPPDNLGLKYRSYVDKLDEEHYLNWLNLIILESMSKAKIVWISFYPKWDLELSCRICKLLKLFDGWVGINFCGPTLLTSTTIGTVLMGTGRF